MDITTNSLGLTGDIVAAIGPQLTHLTLVDHRSEFCVYAWALAEFLKYMNPSQVERLSFWNAMSRSKEAAEKFHPIVGQFLERGVPQLRHIEWRCPHGAPESWLSSLLKRAKQLEVIAFSASDDSGWTRLARESRHGRFLDDVCNTFRGSLVYLELDASPKEFSRLGSLFGTIDMEAPWDEICRTIFGVRLSGLRLSGFSLWSHLTTIRFAIGSPESQVFFDLCYPGSTGTVDLYRQQQGLAPRERAAHWRAVTSDAGAAFISETTLRIISTIRPEEFEDWQQLARMLDSCFASELDPEARLKLAAGLRQLVIHNHACYGFLEHLDSIRELQRDDSWLVLARAKSRIFLSSSASLEALLSHPHEEFVLNVLKSNQNLLKIYKPEPAPIPGRLRHFTRNKNPTIFTQILSLWMKEKCPHSSVIEFILLDVRDHPDFADFVPSSIPERLVHTESVPLLSALLSCSVKLDRLLSYVLQRQIRLPVNTPESVETMWQRIADAVCFERSALTVKDVPAIFHACWTEVMRFYQATPKLRAEHFRCLVQLFPTVPEFVEDFVFYNVPLPFDIPVAQVAEIRTLLERILPHDSQL